MKYYIVLMSEDQYMNFKAMGVRTMTDDQVDEQPLKVSYKTTVHIRDVVTGREERKVLKDGEMISHEIVNEGTAKED